MRQSVLTVSIIVLLSFKVVPNFLQFPTFTLKLNGSFLLLVDLISFEFDYIFEFD